MRIEGTYTFAATSKRVFAAITEAETLARVLPGCERLIQLGPVGADGSATFEARLQPPGAATATTMTISVLSARAPEHLRIELRGYGAWGTFSARGSLDLVAQEEHTIGAYALELETAEQSAERTQAGQQLARVICERVASELRKSAPAETPVEVEIPVALPELGAGVAFAVKTPRGTIVALPSTVDEASMETPKAWAQRALWMGTGLLIGISALALSAGLARWLTERDD